jgi:hypothetical protein
MKKILPLLWFLLLGSAHAQQWIPYSQTSQGTQYFDLQRAVVMGGSTAFILDLHDMKSELNDGDGKIYRSIVYATEFNCRKEQRRVLSVQRKSEPMGKGIVVTETSQVSDWIDVKTQNALRLMMAACEQR